MIITVAELREYTNIAATDTELEARLQALESAIRKYTNNNFNDMGYRTVVSMIANNVITVEEAIFEVGDTIQLNKSRINKQLYTVISVSGREIIVDKDVKDEYGVFATKVVYPPDIKFGIVGMIKWDFENRSKIGIQSETISRHSVTYFNMDGDNSIMGYPKSLLGFLKPYKKARF